MVNAGPVLGASLDPQGLRLDLKPWSMHQVNTMFAEGSLGARPASP